MLSRLLLVGLRILRNLSLHALFPSVLRRSYSRSICRKVPVVLQREYVE